MTIQATKFTPEILLSAPRRGQGLPNSSGTKILYTSSTYSFETHKKTDQIRVLDIESGETSVVSENSSFREPLWIGDEEILLLDNSESGEGTTSLVFLNLGSGREPQTVHRIEGIVSNLKAKPISEGDVAIACCVETAPDGSMHRPSPKDKPLSSAKVYSGLYVRHWDTWKTEARNSVWYGLLKKKSSGGGGGYDLEKPGLVNALAGTKLECPVPPFGGTDHFDISASGLAFVARDPALCPARHTKSDLYYLAIPSFTERGSHGPRIVETGELRGYSMEPKFSHDGKRIAFARMRDIRYEADKTRLMVISDVEDLDKVEEFYATEDGEGGWDFSPSGINWSADDKELFITAEKHGRVVLFKLPSSPGSAKAHPCPIHDQGSVTGFRLLSKGDHRLLITTASLVESACYSILDPRTKELTVVSSATKNGKSLGLSASQCSDTWFEGCDGRRVHAWVMKPSDFSPSKKYPLAFLIHGGPQGAWTDGWSTRWNPAVFAEQGYVAVMANPTGSTGYGQKFTDRIQNEWGGRPYHDLERCWEHVKDTMPFVDVENGVALGASYGGYMINWIQGHPLGRKFKALVCHDGVFSTVNQWSTEELFFPLREFGGPIWERRETYEKWDPSKFTDQWATPMLVIHNELDYRLPISEGLAMFNVLQARGIPSRFLMFPDENHWVLKHENSLVWHREVLGFINKYSGIESADATSDPTIRNSQL